MISKHQRWSVCILLASCLLPQIVWGQTAPFADAQEFSSVVPPSPPRITLVDPDVGDSAASTDTLQAEVESLRQRLDALESKNATAEEANMNLQQLQEELESLQGGSQLVPGLKKHFVTAGSSGSTINLFGRIHLDYWGFPDVSPGAAAFEGEDPQNRFLFRRVRIGVGGVIKDRMVYKIETELAAANDFEFRDVYFGFLDLPHNQTVLFGNQKRPYGLDHLNSSRFNVFIERPFVIEAFNEDSRRLGVCYYGFSDDLRWNWRYGVYNLERIQDDGKYVGDNIQPQIAGRLATTYWWKNEGRSYAHFGIAGTIAYPDGDGGLDHENEARFRTRPEARTNSRWLNTGRIANADRYELLGLEKVLNFGPLQLVGEYQQLWLQRDQQLSELQFWGAYCYAAYFLTGEYMPWDRESGTLDRIKPNHNFFLVDRFDCDDTARPGWGAWQIAARFSHADLSDNDILGGIGTSFTLGINWYWNPNARLQFNYIHGRIHDHQAVNGYTAGDYDIIGVRGGVDF